VEDELGGSRATLVRQSLVEESAPRVSALLNSLASFELHGDESHRAIRQVAVLRGLAERGAQELPKDFDLSMADPVWHAMLASEDRKKALAALKACAMTTVRKGLRGGCRTAASTATERSN